MLINVYVDTGKRRLKTKSKHPFCFELNVNGTARLFHTEQSTFISRNFSQEEVKQETVIGRFSTLLDFEEIKRYSSCDTQSSSQ